MAMKMMIRNLGVLLFSWAAVAAFAAGEIVEEETWYGADGKVVKTVKRTLTGTDARSAPDWEPQWVIREKQRGTRNVRRYSSDNRRGYGYWPYWGARYCSSGSRRSCYRNRGRSYFTGLHRGGGSGWGVGYQSSGLSIQYCR